MSDRAPISFGIKQLQRKQHDSVPAWVAFDADFAEEVRLEMEYLTQRRCEQKDADLNAYEQLDILEMAILNASTYVRKKTSVL